MKTIVRRKVRVICSYLRLCVPLWLDVRVCGEGFLKFCWLVKVVELYSLGNYLILICNVLKKGCKVA